MQETIRRLQEYWAARGCQVWQPHSEKLGAGTMNPATVLRVLGPEPWNVAYVEPSFRADDGRYAENPNRMQMHTQFQVLLKPDPGNPQELYLGSLEAIGLERVRHDIRFVEDNWESPALGAWGLGWEVWLDGQEITQFTYFQQAGGVSLDPVSVEITYGLERIVMYLQQRTEVWSIDFDGVHTYGEIYRQQEIEHCIYNFELADVERQRTLCDLYYAEAEACIARGLVAPAHDYVLRQSQAFNILDTRGAIGVTERAKFFAAMRTQARRISELYVEQRLREEYPWLADSEGAGSQAPGSGDKGKEPKKSASSPSTAGPQSLLIELGSEELPAADVPLGIVQMELRLRELLEQARLAHGVLSVNGTPRRLVAHVQGLAPHQQDEVVERRGPPAARAFDADGQPTKAAVGFARGQGVQVADLEVRDRYVYAVSKKEGAPAADMLPQLIEDLLDGMRWGRTMRWNNSNKSYPRPLRWIVALYGSEIVPVAWAHVRSGRVSRGPRFRDARAGLPAGEFTTFAIAGADSYFDAAAAQGIVLRREERRSRIEAGVQEAAARSGGTAAGHVDRATEGSGGLTIDNDLLEEVTDLVEAPLAVLGAFEDDYLELPQPILTAVMKKHQRYFPVVAKRANGKDAPPLLPRFVTIVNSDRLAHPDVVRSGNEGVIRARYADAAFFFRQDTAKPLDTFTQRLETLTFHTKLGSMLEKVDRLRTLAPQIALMLGAGEKAAETTRKAAALCKSDLVTSMVVEMTGLQGVMGEFYAARSGEPVEVARAIGEHYLPRFDGDAIPKSEAGLALSLADKIDSLIGLFGAGVTPSGSADPFGLRRAALGIVNTLTIGRHSFDLTGALEQACSQYGGLLSETALSAAREFIIRRLDGRLRESGHRPDIVEAALAARGDNPCAAAEAARHLAAAVAAPGWAESFTAYARCARIVRSIDKQLHLDPAAYQVEEEHRLHRASQDAAAKLAEAGDAAAVLGPALASLTAPISRFFDAVLVNAEEENVRLARQALVQQIALLPAPVADLSRLQGF